ncbi:MULTISPECIES: flagellar hook protein FlgE [Desulfitobacterium]|uniref:Flagellar hook protein FlgE n=1 Tax=Desulfitobacterium dehalogenans (strain ATCC 51507 / DSM 9161 / JW/IU-DC1) TaxID=756499 RepID=I4ACU7_DESDJ|nr:MULTISPECIES: flagellar hook protein FlgE [Desulfitobacterium]AFM01782.1 flagellar hook-basal body protein [Desulfitobacterium dehalogenans ATCC 51507]
MLRSLYSAISGLKNHQIKMDVIGNNIANVNTTGFKRSRVTFSTMLSQTMKGAGSPSANQGGTNPAQIGLGSMVSSIDQIMTPGSSQNTGKSTDAMIQGRGFFVFRNAGQIVYGRAGAFSQDQNGYLIDPGTGAFVLGQMWGANDREVLEWGSTPLTPLRFNIGSYPPEPEGKKIDINLGDFVQNGSNYEYVNPALIGASATVPTGGTLDPTTGKITFTAAPTGTGTPPVVSITNIDYDKLTLTPGDFVQKGNVYVYENPDLVGATLGAITGGSFDPKTGTITLNAAPPSAGVAITGVDGRLRAKLDEVTIDGNGIITGIYSNGKGSASRRIGQLAIANFANDAGLQNVGNNFYSATNNSGIADIGAAGTAGRGNIIPNSVEMSNVDLSQEFTDMIVTQRGFQANSRVITVSDSLLQELIDLKR